MDNLTNSSGNASSFDRCDPPDQASDGGSSGVDVNSMIGVALATLSALISTVALLIMKRSADVEVGLPLMKRWRWWIGFIMNTTSELSLSTVALALAPLSIIAPVFGMTVIFSALLARSGLVPGIQEMLSCCEWICLLIALFGIVLCSIFGPSSETAIQYDEYEYYFVQPQFLAYAIPACALVVGWMSVLLCTCFEPIRPHPQSLTTSLFSALGAGTAGSFSIVFSKIFTTALIHRLISASDTSVLTMWITWLGIVGLVCCAPTQLWLLNSALGSGKAAFTVPLYTVMVTTNNIVQGGTLFDEFTCLAREPRDAAIFACAMVLVLAGVAVLSAQQESKKGKGASGADALPNAIPASGPFVGIAVVCVEEEDAEAGGGGSGAPPKASLARFASKFGMSALGQLPARLSSRARPSLRKSAAASSTRSSARGGDSGAAGAARSSSGGVIYAHATIAVKPKPAIVEDASPTASASSPSSHSSR